MGLVDRYKEVLKAQGINANIESYKPKKDYTKIIIILIAIAIMLPLYFLVFQNYNACSITANLLSNQNSGATNSSAVTSSFSFKCATNSILYSASIALVVVIICSLFYKGIKKWGAGKLKFN